MEIKQEELSLYGPARELFAKVREALDRDIGRYAADGEGWKLGGGTVLSARWKHRESNDLYVLYHRDTATVHFERSLRPAMERVEGKWSEWCDLSRITFGAKHVNLVKATPSPKRGHRKAAVDRHATTVLSTVQILSEKLQSRVLGPPVRDIYDVAVCGIEDPESLEMAINGLYATTLDSMILYWEMRKAEHAKEAAKEINGAPPHLKVVQAQPAQYAIRAAENSMYAKLAISAKQGTITVETSSVEATRRRRYTSESGLEEAFESNGFNHFLRANRRNPRKVREQAAKAIRRGETEAIIEITPAPLPRRQEHLQDAFQSARADR